jgi:1-acyl-sn-glycerol-3-phosphate acyltransferase
LNSFDALTEINLDDLVASFGWQKSPRLAGVLRRIFRHPARKFAAQMLDFDRLVGEENLSAGARRLLRGYVQDVRLFGLENIPDSGPLLVLSNHPGMTDALALFAGIKRPVRIIALNRPFLQSLPHTSKNLLFVSDNASERMGAVKKAAAHLRNGGVVLTFPAGKIEPDPDVYPGALESLNNWTDSAGVFLRLAPGTRIVPVLVRNVLWDKAVKHPLTKLKQIREEREKLGAAFQLLAHILFAARPVTVKIQFARPVSADELDSTELPAIHAAVLERMRGLLQNPPIDAGISALECGNPVPG